MNREETIALAEKMGIRTSTMKNPIFKRRIEWIMESLFKGDGKTEEEAREAVTNMVMEDSHTIKNKLCIREFQLDELIDEEGAFPEYGTPEWHENHNNEEKYWEEYHKVGGFPTPRSTHYDWLDKRKKEENA